MANDIFHRPALARDMARQMLNPGPLDVALRSGLFLSGIRRTGKTTFLLGDLIPALEAHGAMVIYVDLWSDVQAPPSRLVHAAIAEKLEEIQNPASGLLARLKKLSSAEVAAYGVKFGFKLDSIGKDGGTTLAAALRAAVDQAKTDIVLIVDEVQQALATEDGNTMLLALKAARDAINARPGTPGRLIFMGTGSHRAHVNELVTRKNQAFAGAHSAEFEVLGADYVAHLLDRLQQAGGRWPGQSVTEQAFVALGHRPEELLKALRLVSQQLQIQPGEDPDHLMPVVAATLRSSASDLELYKVQNLGELAEAIFDRLAQQKDASKGLFSADAAEEYTKAIGRAVRIEEIQPVVNALLAENVVMRRGHGQYSISDPFVQETWLERKKLLQLAAPNREDG